MASVAPKDSSCNALISSYDLQRVLKCNAPSFAVYHNRVYTKKTVTAVTPRTPFIHHFSEIHPPRTRSQLSQIKRTYNPQANIHTVTNPTMTHKARYSKQ